MREDGECWKESSRLAVKEAGKSSNGVVVITMRTKSVTDNMNDQYCILS